MCATTKPRRSNTAPHPQPGVTDLDRGAQGVDGLLNAGCTLQQTRELLTAKSTGDCAAAPGAHPREDIGASMLIAEELEPSLDVPVEVVPMEELERCWPAPATAPW